MSALHDRQKQAFERRRQQMLVYRTKGWSDVRIAEKYGMTRQRVGQILGPKKNGAS